METASTRSSIPDTPLSPVSMPVAKTPRLDVSFEIIISIMKASKL